MEKTYINHAIKELFERIKQIEDYRKNNPGCDPNAYEMVEILSIYKSIVSQSGKQQQTLKSDELDYIREVVGNFLQPRMSQFNELNTQLQITQKSALCEYFNFAFSSKDSALEDEKVESICARACGINFFIQQQLRENLNKNSNDILYSNDYEYEKLNYDITNSNLPSEVEKAIKNLKAEIETAHNKTPKGYIQEITKYYENSNDKSSQNKKDLSANNYERC